MAHDANTGGHFGFSKTISRLEMYHWRLKTRDVKRYVTGCLVYEQKKDHGGNKLTEPSSLGVPETRWGSLVTDFIVGLPKTKNGFDCITNVGLIAYHEESTSFRRRKVILLLMSRILSSAICSSIIACRIA